MEFDVSGSLLDEEFTHDERVAFMKKVDRFLRDRISCDENIMPYMMYAIPDDDYEKYSEDWTLSMDTPCEFAEAFMNDIEEEW